MSFVFPAAHSSPRYSLPWRHAWLGAGLLALVSAAAAAGWWWSSKHGDPSGADLTAAADAPRIAGMPGLMPTKAAPQAAVEGASAAAGGPAPSFEESCLKPIRLKRFADAIEGCGRFVDTPKVGGHAHAALAAIYATRSYINVAASVHHAQMAAAAGDGRGKFMVAYHQLTGMSGQPFDLARTRALLEEARTAGVARAQQYIVAIDDSIKCREQASFKLFDQALFCLFRPEVSQLLLSKGMTERQKDLEQWLDSYRPGDVLPTSESAVAVYDRDPQEELQRLARFSYRFSVGEGGERLQLLRQALTDKYGQPVKLSAREANGGSGQWQLADGVRISLGRDEDGSVLVNYTLPVRWEARSAHLKREAELVQNAQLMRDQMAL